MELAEAPSPTQSANQRHSSHLRRTLREDKVHRSRCCFCCLCCFCFCFSFSFSFSFCCLCLCCCLSFCHSRRESASSFPLAFAFLVVILSTANEPAVSRSCRCSSPNPATNRYPKALALGLITQQRTGALALRYALLPQPHPFPLPHFPHTKIISSKTAQNERVKPPPNPNLTKTRTTTGDFHSNNLAYLPAGPGKL
jgi:hypothetical protein